MPFYPALFGRDAITATWQASMLDQGEQLDHVPTRPGRPQGTRPDPPPAPRRVGGLRLPLVAQAASDWGLETTLAGKSVWCEVEPQRPVASPPPDVGSTDQSPSDEHDRDRADRRGAAVT